MIIFVATLANDISVFFFKCLLRGTDNGLNIQILPVAGDKKVRFSVCQDYFASRNEIQHQEIKILCTGRILTCRFRLINDRLRRVVHVWGQEK